MTVDRSAETALAEALRKLAANYGVRLDPPHDPEEWHGGMAENIAECPTCYVNAALACFRANEQDDTRPRLPRDMEPAPNMDPPPAGLSRVEAAPGEREQLELRLRKHVDHDEAVDIAFEVLAAGWLPPGERTRVEAADQGSTEPTDEVCRCGLRNPGPEHRAYYPMLCSDKPSRGSTEPTEDTNG